MLMDAVIVNSLLEFSDCPGSPDSSISTRYLWDIGFRFDRISFPLNSLGPRGSLPTLADGPKTSTEMTLAICGRPMGSLIFTKCRSLEKFRFVECIDHGGPNRPSVWKLKEAEE